MGVHDASEIKPPKDLFGTYETWRAFHGTEPPSYTIIDKVVFGRDGYYYEYLGGTISYQKYEYDHENNNLRFSWRTSEKYFYSWEKLEWHNKKLFCIVNVRCYNRISSKASID